MLRVGDQVQVDGRPCSMFVAKLTRRYVHVSAWSDEVLVLGAPPPKHLKPGWYPRRSVTRLRDGQSRGRTWFGAVRLTRAIDV